MNDRAVNVLFIEENAADARLIREMMSEASRLGWDLPRFEVERVNRLEAGLERLEAAASDEAPRIDVVLTDLSLPAGPAEETFATLRARFPHLPVVVLTEREDGKLARRNVHAGTQNTLLKADVTGGLLAQAVTYAVERQEAKRALEETHDKLEARVRERTEALRQANRELEAEIAERKRAEEERKRYIQELQLTNDAIVRLSRMQDVDRMCAFIGEKVHAVNEGAYVFVTLYDEEQDAIGIRAMMGLRKAIERTSDILGLDPTKITIRRDEMGEAAKLYTTGRLERVSLYELGAGKLPRAVCPVIKRLLNIDTIYTVGFALEDEPYGGVTILLPRGREVRYRSAIETLASHLSVMIQRREAEGALRKSEERLRRIVDGTRAMLVNVDQRGRITYVNEAAATMLEHRPEDLIDKLYLRFVHPEDRDRVSKAYKEQLEIGTPSTSLEFRVITGSGDVKWVNFAAHPIAEEGEAGLALDVTERKRMEKALRESEEHYRSLFEDSPISLWEEDFSAVKAYIDDLRAAGVEDFRAYFESHPESIAHCARLVKVIDVNRATLEVFEAGSQEEFLEGLSAIFTPETYPAFTEELVAIAEGKVRLKTETVNRTLMGNKVHISMNWRVVPGYEETYSKVLVSLVDVTERKQAEKKIERYAADLERSNEELQQFAYVASHDLQAPLRTMRGYLNLLERRCGDQLDDRSRQYVDRAVESAHRMREMIMALLDLSRVETRGRPFASTDCERVLENALKALQHVIEESGAEVTHDPLPTVMADDVQLRQVFQNLIANGIKFRREDEPPRVHISAERRPPARPAPGGPARPGGPTASGWAEVAMEESRDEERWVFSVTDNGIGIDPEQVDRLFRLFRRLHTEEEYPGLGMGLALCRRIVERHGGHIWVESEPGKGSTFRFTIPARGT